MNLRELANLYNLEDLAISYGVKLHGNNNKWGICPLPDHIHHNYTASFSVFTDKGRQKFKCHGSCGARGDAIDFIGYMKIRNYYWADPDHRKRAAQILQYEHALPTGPFVIKSKPKYVPAFIWQDFLPLADNVRAYLHTRGIIDEVIETHKFGSAVSINDGIRKNNLEPLLSIPAFENGTLKGIKLRHINRKMYFSYPGTKPGLWNHDEVYLTEQPVLVAKGEICAAVMKSAGFLACGLTFGENNNKGLELARDALLLSPNIIYFSDNDAHGRHSGPAIATFIGAQLAYPETGKDWDEWYLKDPKACMKQTYRLLSDSPDRWKGCR